MKSVIIILIASLYSINVLATADGGCVGNGISEYSSVPGPAFVTIGSGETAKTLKATHVNYKGTELVWLLEDGSVYKRFEMEKMDDSGLKPSKDLETIYMAEFYDASTGRTTFHKLFCEI